MDLDAAGAKRNSGGAPALGVPSVAVCVRGVAPRPVVGVLAAAVIAVAPVPAPPLVVPVPAAVTSVVVAAPRLGEAPTTEGRLRCVCWPCIIGEDLHPSLYVYTYV